MSQLAWEEMHALNQLRIFLQFERKTPPRFLQWYKKSSFSSPPKKIPKDLAKNREGETQ